MCLTGARLLRRGQSEENGCCCLLFERRLRGFHEPTTCVYDALPILCVVCITHCLAAIAQLPHTGMLGSRSPLQSCVQVVAVFSGRLPACNPCNCKSTASLLDVAGQHGITGRHACSRRKPPMLQTQTLSTMLSTQHMQCTVACRDQSGHTASHTGGGTPPSKNVVCPRIHVKNSRCSA